MACFDLPFIVIIFAIICSCLANENMALQNNPNSGEGDSNLPDTDMPPVGQSNDKENSEKFTNADPTPSTPHPSVKNNTLSEASSNETPRNPKKNKKETSTAKIPAPETPAATLPTAEEKEIPIPESSAQSTTSNDAGNETSSADNSSLSVTENSPTFTEQIDLNSATTKTTAENFSDNSAEETAVPTSATQITIDITWEIDTATPTSSWEPSPETKTDITEYQTPESGKGTENRSPDQTHIYVITIIILLIFAIVILGVYLYKLRRKRTKNSRRRSSLFLKLSRRHSHPIKVKDLPKTTADLLASAGHLLEMEFEDLNVISEAQRGEICEIALTPENKNKNRYFNILPYGHSRVLLKAKADDPNSTYINASFVTGFNGPKEYIASQGPKSDTVEDFWRMIWEQNVRVIVMVTGLEERGKQKCDQYWPDVDQTLTLDCVSVKHVGEKTAEVFIQRTFEAESGGTSRIVHQFCFRDWPDFGCPASPEVLIKFIETIRTTHSRVPCDGGNSPFLVHCSAGVGRTGTFIVVDWLMQEANVSEEIDIFSTILRVRNYRMKLVQSEEQYEYIYKCLSHYVTTRALALSTRQKGDSDQEHLIGRSNSIPLIEYGLGTNNSSLIQDIP